MNEIVLNNSSMTVLNGCDLCAASEAFFHADRKLDFHVLIYVIEGVIYVTEDGVDYEVHPGEILFLKSGIRHFGKREIPKGTRWYFIHFYFPETDELPLFVPDSSPFVQYEPVKLAVALPKKLTGLSESSIEQQIEALIAYFHSDDKMKKWSINLRLFDLLSQIAFYHNKEPEGRSLSDKICEYLNAHGCEPFSAALLEQHFFLSYKHMAAVFKKEKQLTLQQYHTRVRMTEACRLLRSTLMSVGEISKELGYHDMLYFSRCFHQFAGESPTEYRRKAKSFY